ncbi:hypothetical protein QQX98_001872 [Neonectria punicea]|uniref:Uncharacterized protein n=1 Tax=Neonectria punicea TaxID=979145 RepID=A0ABR1HMD0_9HYPO
MHFAHVLALAGVAAAGVVPVDAVTYVTTPVPYHNATSTAYPVVPTSESSYPNGTTPSAPSVPSVTPTEPTDVTGAAVPQKMQGSLTALMVLVAAGVLVL